MITAEQVLAALMAYDAFIETVGTANTGARLEAMRLALVAGATGDDATPRCATCGTTENLTRVLGSRGPWHCDNLDC